MTDDLPVHDVRDHYDRIRPVIDELAKVGDAVTIGLNDYSGWYVRRDQDDLEAIEDGFEQKARCATLSDDYDEVSSRIERALYAVTSYKDPESFEWRDSTIEDGSTVWRGGESPTPGYGDLRGVMVWGDVDLVDELKPERGSLSDDTRGLVERTLSAYVEEFAKLYGSREAVFALDSVGGSYIMGAPAATSPIASLFEDDEDARTRVMKAFVSRSNDWLHEAQERVEERVAGASDVIDPDWVNNCNRQYKAPLSLHTDHDAVVTPLDTESVSYDVTSFTDVDDDLVDQTAAWASELTSTRFEDCADSLVEQLWPAEYAEAESWEAALESWVQNEREREKREEEARKRARERREERMEAMGGSLEGAPVTPFLSDVYDAIDALDIENVADRTIVHQWTDRANGLRDNSGDGKRAFVPIWGTNAGSGNANFVDKSTGVWVDTGDDHTGGPVKMALIAEENWNRSETPSGDGWRRGVELLREMGFEIPVWTPDAESTDSSGEEYEKMPYWAVRKAAVALGVLPEDAFIRAQGKEGGYKKFPGRETYNHALAAIEEAGLTHGREYMTDDGGRPDDLSVSTSDEAGDGEEDEPEPIPAIVRVEESGDEPDSGFSAHSELEYNRGGYGKWKTNQDGETWFEPVTNFTIDVQSFLFDDQERLVEMTVVPGTGEEEYDLTVPTKVFNDPRRFRDNIVTGLTTTFDGGASELNELRKLVGSQDAPVRTGTHHMGLNIDTKEWVTPNGVLTADGWTDSPETVYIEREISAEKAWALTPEDHTDYEAEEVAEILELVPQSRHSERFLPVLGWLYSAPLRPYIQQWEGQFNTIHVTGETGAGKSSSLSLGWQLFGMDGEPMACDDTKFALMSAMASTNSIPMWFDEYKPGDMKDWEVDRFQNLMRSTTRGGVNVRGNADKSTEQYHLKAPLMISGEQSIQGPAEERRSIQTRFRDSVKEEGSPTKVAFSKLTGSAYDLNGETVAPEGYDLSQHALAYYRHILGLDGDELEEKWMESRDYVRDLLSSNSIVGVDDLPRQGLQTVHFGMEMYRDFAKQMASEAGMDVSSLELPTESELDEALLYIAKQYGENGTRKSHLDRFIELTSRAANMDYLEEGKHFTFVKLGKSDEQLALKLSSVHDRVSKYVRDHDISGEDLLNSAKDYRDRMAEDEGDAGSYVVTHSQNTPPLNRCARIDTARAEQMLEFSRTAFGVDPRSEDGEESSGDNDDGPGPDAFGALPLDHVASDPTGYATVTVEVLTRENPDHDAAPAMRATVKDTSTAIDVISWNDPKALPESGTFVIKNAEVGKHDGKVQLTIRTGVTEVEPIQSGVGFTESKEPEKNQEQLSGESAGVASDGGTSEVPQEDRKKLVSQLVVKNNSTAKGAPVDDVVADLVDRGVPEDVARHEIENMLEDGNIMLGDSDNHLRPV